MRLNIFSYNIRGLPIFPDSWSSPLGDWFDDSNYDFVCLQEVFTEGRIKMLTDSLLKNNYTVVKPNDFAARSNLLSSGLLTAVRKDLWHILDEGFQYFIQSTPFENITNKGFHWLKLTNKQTKTCITIINTHMQADNPINIISGCLDTRPIRHSQAEQILKQFKNIQNHLIIGDINSESEPHEDFSYLTGINAGIKKHTYIATDEDLDHIAIIPKITLNKPIIKQISVLTKILWSDHWPLFVVLEL
jgi:exonuclease III